MSCRGTATLVLVVLAACVGAPAASAAGSFGTTVPELSPVPPHVLSAPRPPKRTPVATTPTVTTPTAPSAATGHAPLPFTGINLELELILAAAFVGGGIAVAAVTRTRHR
jgi:hypothetical protein